MELNFERRMNRKLKEVKMMVMLEVEIGVEVVTGGESGDGGDEEE